MQSQLLKSVYPRPFLKWAGGKGQLIQQYLPFFPNQFSTYYEPFLGGGAIFFHLLPTRSQLMDINPELVNVYLCVRDQVETLIVQLQEHQNHHSSDYYYWVRSQTEAAPVERAARLIYLNKTCFNGLYRENSKGQFNVPMGSYKNPTICDPDLLRAVSTVLQSTRIEVGHFEAILDEAKSPQDFVYFDPPYHPISATSKFTSYNRYSFCTEDQIQLRDVFKVLAGRGVKVMLSNSDCPFIRNLYQDFPIHTILASRAINSNAGKRGKITEVLVTSFRVGSGE
ncbi:DNA adenine methylase [Kovacikia minuta CCNUW1]|uniref:DNA adenine methylase n=1 Tax=Kovacikia minuta TaxID=2931930 RepID=UPI001CCC15BE|nr:DNA adenine methylase [Kovacikia minuta]UBF27744.1 DNA adenine methylase [Kovacikia minuta CCNUW1]